MRGRWAVQYKQRAITELLIAKGIPPIVFHRHFQAGYGDNVLMQGKLDFCTAD
jgi:hypothetical protein